MEDTPVETYRAVSSDGTVFEVTLLKTTKPADKVTYARAPDGPGYAPRSQGNSR